MTTKQKDAQFIISTHSPILLGYPGAQIFSFDGRQLQEVSYEETAPYLVVRRFIQARETVLDELFGESGALF